MEQPNKESEKQDKHFDNLESNLGALYAATVRVTGELSHSTNNAHPDLIVTRKRNNVEQLKGINMTKQIWYSYCFNAGDKKAR